MYVIIDFSLTGCFPKYGHILCAKYADTNLSYVACYSIIVGFFSFFYILKLALWLCSVFVCSFET